MPNTVGYAHVLKVILSREMLFKFPWYLLGSGRPAQETTGFCHSDRNSTVVKGRV